MAEAKLSVEIEAKLGNFGKDLNSVIGVVENVDKKVTAATNNVSRSLAKTAASAKTSGASFVGLSRVMQDFAFGPAAIANNLQGLATDFSELSRVSKETGQSLSKTLVQSLMGGGGLNLALGGLTLAMSVASFGMGAWTRMFPDAKKEVEDFAASLDLLSQTRLKGNQDAQKEIVALEVLYRAVTDTNRSIQDRKKAYKELQDQYPKYFGNLDFEKTSSEKLATAYNTLRTAVLEAAYARAAQDKIAKNASRSFEDDEKILQERIANEKLRVQLSAIKKIEAAEIEAGINNLVTARKIYNIQKGLEESDTRIFNLTSDKVKLNEQNLRLYEKISKVSVDALTNPGGAVEKDKAPKSKSIPQLAKLSIPGIEQTITQLSALTATVEGMPDKIQRPLSDVGIAFAELGINIDEATQQALGSLAAGFGEILGNLAIGAASFEDVGKLVLGTLGGLMVQVGTMAIQTGIAISAIKKALQSMNPYVAIAAGVALVALGSAVKGGLGKLGAGAGSGGGGSTDAMKITAGYATSGQSLPSGNKLSSVGSARDYNPTFVISQSIKGNELVQMVERQQSRNSRVR